MSCGCVAKFKNGDRIDDDSFVYYPHYVGNNILICGRRSSKFPFQLMVGPDWVCMLVTYTLILVPTFFFLADVGTEIGTWVVVIGCFTCMTVLCFFSLTACSDPGIIYSYPPIHKRLDVDDQTSSGGDEEVGQIEDGSSSVPPVPPQQVIQCGNCAMNRPLTASHCYDCGLCIDEIDHHCPWTGKCIAKRNLSTFYWFLGTLAVHILLVIAFTIYAVFTNRQVFKVPI